MNALLETFSWVYSEITSNLISFFQKLMKGRFRIRAEGLENFSRINKQRGTIIQYSRAKYIFYDSRVQFAINDKLNIYSMIQGFSLQLMTNCTLKETKI